MATPAAVLNILITANTSRANAALTSTQKQLRNTDTVATRTTRRFSGLEKAAIGVGAVLGGALALGARAGWQELQESARVSAQTAAALKSTGRQAGVTARHIEDLATSLMNLSGVDDETIQAAENLLLTFRSVHNEVGKGNNIFDLATRAALDMSVAMTNAGKNTSMATAALQIGKALQDPVRGMTALRRVGVMFTESQTATIKKMVETGNVIGAQKLILAELNKEFGGSAAAAGTTLPGKLNILKETFNNLAGTVMQAAAPALQTVASHLTTFVRQMQSGQGAGGAFAAAMSAVWGVLVKLAGVLGAVVGWIRGLVVQFQQGNPAIVALAGALAGLTVGIVAFRSAMAVATAAQAAFNAVALANPYVLAAAAIAALVGALVVLYMKSAGVRDFVNSAWASMKAVAMDVFPTIRTIAVGAFNVIRTAVNVLKAVFAVAWNFIGPLVRTNMFIVKTAIDVGITAFNLMKGPVSALAGVYVGTFNTIRGIVGKVMDFVLSMLSTFLHGAGGLFDVLSHVPVLGGAFKGLGKTADQAGDDIDRLRGALHGLPARKDVRVGVSVDFFSNIAGAIGSIASSIGGALGAGGGSYSRPGHQGYATGGVVKSLGYFAGEEGSSHPEVIIASNPRYRRRNLGLWAQAGQMLDVPGFAQGGVARSAAGPVVSAAPGWAGRKASDWIKPIAQAWGVSRSVAGRMIAAASRIAGLPYVYGGGHGAAGGYDCSGAVSYLLQAGGLLSGSLTTDGLKGYGLPGRGKYITIGVRGSTGRNAHTMIEFFGRYFESGGGGGLGPHWNAGWDGTFPILRHPPGFAAGGIFRGDFGNVPPAVLLARLPRLAGYKPFQAYAEAYNKIPGFQTGGVVVRGRVSTFGPPLEAAGSTAHGASSASAGISLRIPGTGALDSRNRALMGKMFNVSIAGHSAVLEDIDLGPASWTGRVIDVTGAGARKMGINPYAFPTDATGIASSIGGGGTPAQQQKAKSIVRKIKLFAVPKKAKVPKGNAIGTPGSLGEIYGGQGSLMTVPDVRLPKIQRNTGKWAQIFTVFGDLGTVQSELDRMAYTLNWLYPKAEELIGTLPLDDLSDLSAFITTPPVYQEKDIFGNVWDVQPPSFIDWGKVDKFRRQVEMVLAQRRLQLQWVTEAVLMVEKIQGQLRAAIAARNTEIKRLQSVVAVNVQNLRGWVGDYNKEAKSPHPDQKVLSGLKARIDRVRSMNNAIGGKPDSLGKEGWIGTLTKTGVDLATVADAVGTTKFSLIGYGRGGELAKIMSNIQPLQEDLVLLNPASGNLQKQLELTSNWKGSRTLSQEGKYAGIGVMGGDTGTAATGTDDTTQKQLDLMRQLLTATRQGTAVSTAQMNALSQYPYAMDLLKGTPIIGAFQRGGDITRRGFALVGEQGPELVTLPSGSHIFDNQTSTGMLSGGGDVQPVNVTVQILDGAINPNAIRVIVDDQLRRETRRGARGLPGGGGGYR